MFDFAIGIGHADEINKSHYIELNNGPHTLFNLETTHKGM